MSDSELMSIFWVEVSEHLETLNTQLLQVEMAASSPEERNKAEYTEALKELNRVSHSMKGAARAVGINVVETLSHYMEEVFGSAYNDKLTLTPEICDTLYDGLDIIQTVSDGQEPDTQALALVLASMEQIISRGSASGTSSQEVAKQPETPTQHKTTTSTEQRSSTSETVRASATEMGSLVMRPVEESVRVSVSRLDRLMAEVTELFIARMHSDEQQRSLVELRQVLARWQREWRGVRAAYIRLVRHMQEADDQISTELRALFRFLETNQRHLTEANRQLGQLVQAAAQDNLRLKSLAEQLQTDISQMRLVPFESVAGGLQRMVRDIARDTEKQVNMEIIGAAVEIDKAVLDELKEPLMHLLRNAVDHGLEPPDERRRNAKPEIGHIELEVQQLGSEIVVYVRDDGRGISAEKVRRSIVRNGLMGEAEAAALSDEEARTYIFYSGLTTSDQVTALSGRGMGMDIVRDRIESLRGRVSVQSAINEGTTVVVSVPVSLTRLRCILLRIGTQQFALPAAMVVRINKVDRSVVFTTEGRESLMIGRQPVPLVSIGSVLDIPARNGDPRLNYVALRAADRTVAFEVDEVFSETELVLKPLGPELERARFVSGAALLGSGEVIIVLDANDLVRQATGAALPRRRIPAINTAAVASGGRKRVLVVDDSITTRTLEKNILETAGFEVHVAIDGQEAWELLSQTHFDVIISDVEMPVMNGLELTQRIKSNSQYQRLPVILLTSLSQPEQREAGLRAGADAYLVKSRFDQAELLETIQSVV